MIVLVDGKRAVLEDDFSFEYIAENRLFMGRDGYTLNISFPMRDCPGNIAIFGHLHRIDVAKDNVLFNCSILDTRTTLNGTLRITKIGDKSIEGQFAEGRCEQVVTAPGTKKEKYVNELDLGTPQIEGELTPYLAWKSIDQGNNAVALPWINEASPTQFNNWAVFNRDHYEWDKGVLIDHKLTTAESPSLKAEYLSWQPYLIYIAKKILQAEGYTYDFAAWEASNYRFLIICNTLPYTWTEDSFRNFASVLPRWTVAEFFEKLESLLMCEFDFDHKTKHVKFSFSKDVLAETPPVKIECVVDEYSVDVEDEDASCEYIGAKRWAYKECSHCMQPYYACDWFSKESPNIYTSFYLNTPTLLELNKRHYITFPEGPGTNPTAPREAQIYGEKEFVTSQMLTAGKTYYVEKDDVERLLYSREDQTHFVFRSIDVEKNPPGRLYDAQIYVPQPINVFGSGIPESDDVDTEEIEFVPVCISDTHISAKDDMGYMMYLSPSSYQDDASTETSDEKGVVKQTQVTTNLLDGEKEKSSEYYNVIYVAFWDGKIPEPKKAPFPIIDRFCVTQDWEYIPTDMPGLRLTDLRQQVMEQLPNINHRQKFKFSWIGNGIPNPRAMFYIKGQRYVCEKITATFTKNGLSQLFKGEFYPVIGG